MLPTLLSVITACTPLGPGEKVLVVVAPSAPELNDRLIYARALVSDSAPFATLDAKRTREALLAESGIRDRRLAFDQGRRLLAEAETAYSRLEAQSALEKIAQATPSLVASQAEPAALEALTRSHLLAGTILVAQNQPEAAQARLVRALDLEPTLRPLGTAQLLGVLESVRAEKARRTQGSLEVALVGTATQATVFIDGRAIGQAPGRFDNLPVGRHLLRVSSPGLRSLAGTVRIDAAEDARLQVRLQVDRELEDVARIGPQLMAGTDISETQAALTERAGATRTLVATLVASSHRTKDGDFKLGLLLDLEGAGRTTSDAVREDVEAAMSALAQCTATSGTRELGPAPPLNAFAPLMAPHPVPPPTPLWRRSWVWVSAAVVAVTALGTLAAVQGASAPPEDITVDLVPRP